MSARRGAIRARPTKLLGKTLPRTSPGIDVQSQALGFGEDEPAVELRPWADRAASKVARAEGPVVRWAGTEANRLLTLIEGNSKASVVDVSPVEHARRLATLWGYRDDHVAAGPHFSHELEAVVLAVADLEESASSLACGEATGGSKTTEANRSDDQVLAWVHARKPSLDVATAAPRRVWLRGGRARPSSSPALVPTAPGEQPQRRRAGGQPGDYEPSRHRPNLAREHPSPRLLRPGAMA